MTDQSAGLPATPAKPGYLRTLASPAAPRGELRPATAWAVCALLLALLLRHFWVDEGEFANILFTVAVTGTLVATILGISRRALFATVVVASLVAAIVAAADAKRAVMNMVVHA